jgi:2-polyprenyl-6-methoxyphenol hydroxylase-like FAD-dependent oxidoreductase
VHTGAEKDIHQIRTIHTRCCVAGGGPAGIMLGYLLARAGIDVVVLEMWPDFFRDFRGDTIHPSTMQVLYELDLLEEFLKLPHSEMQQMAAHMGGVEVTVADFSRLDARTPFIAFIPQWDFLNFLSSKAKGFSRFHLMMETKAIDIIQEDERTVGVRAHDKEGDFEIRAELVIGADGRHSVIREKARLPVEDYGAPIDVLWFRLSRTDDGTKRSLGYIDGGRGLIMLDRNDYWQCGFIIAKGGFDAIKSRGIEEFRRDIASLAPFLSSTASELKDWQQIKLLSVSVDHLSTWYQEGLVCIGDSAHAMSPVGGIGINLAIQDAVAAANILVPVFRNGIPAAADLAAIQARRQPPTRWTQRLQVFLHRRVLGPVLNNKNNGSMRLPFFLRLFKLIPLLQWFPAYVIGVGFRPEHVRIEFKTDTETGNIERIL